MSVSIRSTATGMKCGTLFTYNSFFSRWILQYSWKKYQHHCTPNKCHSVHNDLVYIGS
jgi:hypothetical protein